MNTLYPAIFEPQEPSGYFVRFIDIPEAITQGQTIEECMFNGSEVLSLVLEEHLDSEREIPQPSANIQGAHCIAPDARIQSAILVRWARGNRSLADITSTSHPK